jgi:uncharacterized protein (TIGR00369 family)
MVKSVFSKLFKDRQEFLAEVPHVSALGIELLDFSPHGVSLKLPYREDLVADPEDGLFSGGAISAFLDNTCGYAVSARTDRDNVFATLDLRIDYMKPATVGKDVLSFAECYKMTRRIAFVRGVAYHKNRNEPIANATATFMFTGPAGSDTRENL